MPILVLLSALAATSLAAPPPQTSSGEALLCLSVRAWVDGVSDLVIQPQTIYWHNREHAKPGTPADQLIADVPTLLDDKPWLPRWQGEKSDRLNTRHFPPTFAGLAVVLARTEARGNVELVEPGNQQMTIRFTDRALDADWYHVWLVAVPEAFKPLADALAEGLARAAARDGEAAAKAADRLRAYLAETDVPEAVRDRALAQILACAVEACRAVDFERAEALLGLAEAVQPKDRAVTDLDRWLAKASKPLFSDEFERSSLGRWGAVEGDWRVAGGQLECVIDRHHGRAVLQGVTLRDFVLAFDAVSIKPFTVRFGTLFRAAKSGCFGFFLCDAHNQLVGGEVHNFSSEPVGSPHQPVAMHYAWGGFRYPVQPVRKYRMAMRAVGPVAECYVDGQIVARISDRRPTVGGLGLYVFEGGCRFDNVRIYKPVPLPREPATLAKTPLAGVSVPAIR
jgi:hypothetical protein